MAEQQLVDYIKKAKGAGQSDEQSRTLLLKNGWTEAEINSAFASINQPQPQAQPQTNPQPEAQPQPQMQVRPEVEQPKVEQPKTENQPKPQYQTQPVQPMQSNMPKMRTGSHFVLKLLVVLIILIVLGVAGYFTAGQYLNLPYSSFFSNLFGPNPQTVIAKMMTSMADVRSYQTIIQGSVNATDNKNASQSKVLFSIDNKSDATDVNNLKADATFTIQATSNKSASPLMSANISLLTVNNTSYIKINNLTLPDGFSYPGVDFSQLKGQYLKIDQDSINSLSQAGGVGIDVSQMSNPGLTKEIQDLLLSEDMFSDSKKLGSEVVSGQNTYHYLVNISKDKIKDLINKSMALQAQNSGTANSSLLVMSMAQSYVNSFVDALGDISIELWIGKKDYMLYKYKIDKTIDLNKINPGANATISIRLDATNSNFGKPVSVQAPITSQKIEDILSPLTEMQGVPFYIYQLNLLAKSIFSANQSYSTLCNRGLLNGYQSDYGTDLINLNNNIINLGGKKPLCFADTTDFCVSTQLSDGSFLCVDKNGMLQNSECLSAKDSCLPSL